MPDVPATCFKFTVGSAAEAAELVRDRLGPHARVLSVRSIPAGGWRRFWAAPRLEIVACAEPPAPSPEAAPAPRAAAPPTGDLRGLLTRAGFSEAVLARLGPAWAGLAALPLHRGLVEAGRQLGALARPSRERLPLERAAFIGLPGAGRTTALCKWLALEVFRHGRKGHVVTAEFDRPNPPGVLPVFCEALGVPLAHFPALTQPAAPGNFVYFDLPGISLRDPGANSAIAAFVDREAIKHRVLVLNAAYDPAVLAAARAAGRELGATHVALTHLDELGRWGRLWDHLLDDGLDPLLLSTGPALTGDCEVDAFDALARRTLPAAPETDTANLAAA